MVTTDAWPFGEQFDHCDRRASERWGGLPLPRLGLASNAGPHVRGPSRRTRNSWHSQPARRGTGYGDSPESGNPFTMEVRGGEGGDHNPPKQGDDNNPHVDPEGRPTDSGGD